MQKTITINGVKFTPTAIRRSGQIKASGGHNIALTKVGSIHWVSFGDEIHIFNCGAVHRKGAFGSKVAFLA